MRSTALMIGLLLFLSAGSARATEIETEQQKVIYALGVAVAKGLAQFDLSESEVEYLLAGIADKLADRSPRVELDQYMPSIDGLARERRARLAEAEKQAAQGFLARALTEGGAIKTESGLVYREIEPGDGPTPTAQDEVQVHYHGTLHDGTVFDSSKERGQPARFRVGGVIACWTEALQRMKVGGNAIITCPPEIAYGDRGAGDKILPGAALRFEVELLAIQPSPGG